MKRLILLGIFLFTVSFSFAANKMSMVTYFPVPYVAYSQVSVDQQLDVGLTSTCTMNLGCRESGTNLNANVVNLKSGKLELNQGKGVVGDKILLGSGSGNGQIQFSNVRIQGGTIQSVNAGDMNVKSLQLFDKPFPPCKGKGGIDGQMHWAELSLKGAGAGKKELYLVCGDAPDSSGEEESDCCAEDFTGDFAECIKQKYGYNSAEYICAAGASQTPLLSGAAACLWALNLGSNTSYVKDQTWVSSERFKRYACSSGPGGKERPQMKRRSLHCASIPSYEHSSLPDACQYSIECGELGWSSGDTCGPIEVFNCNKCQKSPSGIGWDVYSCSCQDD